MWGGNLLWRGFVNLHDLWVGNLLWIGRCHNVLSLRGRKILYSHCSDNMLTLQGRNLLFHRGSHNGIDMHFLRGRNILRGGSFSMRHVPSGNLFWSRGSHSCHKVSR